MKRILIIILIILLVLAIIKTLNKNDTNNTMTDNIKEEIGENQVGVISTEFSNYYIDVTIRNNKNIELKQLTVIAHCYDKNGINLGDKQAFEFNVKPKETYKKRVYVGNDVKTYNIELKYTEK